MRGASWPKLPSGTSARAIDARAVDPSASIINIRGDGGAGGAHGDFARPCGGRSSTSPFHPKTSGRAHTLAWSRIDNASASSDAGEAGVGFGECPLLFSPFLLCAALRIRALSPPPPPPLSY